MLVETAFLEAVGAEGVAEKLPLDEVGAELARWQMPRAIGCLDPGTVSARHHEGIGERDDVLDQIVPRSQLATWPLTLRGARDSVQLWVSSRPEQVEEGRWSVPREPQTHEHSAAVRG